MPSVTAFSLTETLDTPGVDTVFVAGSTSAARKLSIFSKAPQTQMDYAGYYQPHAQEKRSPQQTETQAKQDEVCIPQERVDAEAEKM